MQVESHVFKPADLSSLAMLDALLQEASVTKAARRMGVSTPAASHALAKLRERTGDPLLVRAGKAMVLTPHAEALRPLARDAVAAASRVFERDEGFSPETMRRELTVSLTDYVLLVFGSALDEVLTAEAPGLDVRFLPNAVEDGERLRSGGTDLALGIYGPLPPELKARPIITDRLVCVLRREHPQSGEALTLERFTRMEHIQIAPRGRPGGYLDQVLAAQGTRRRVARAVPYFQVALEMAATSDRALVVSERIARKLAPALGLKIFEVPLELKPFALSMVWHPRFQADRGHAWFRERLVQVTAGRDGLSHANARRQLEQGDPTIG